MPFNVKRYNITATKNTIWTYYLVFVLLAYPLYFLYICMWNIPGSIKARSVPQVAPTSAMRLAKLGIAITTRPVTPTIRNRKTFWKRSQQKSYCWYKMSSYTIIILLHPVEGAKTYAYRYVIVNNRIWVQCNNMSIGGITLFQGKKRFFYFVESLVHK